MKKQEFKLVILLLAVASAFTLMAAFDLLWRGLHRFPAQPVWDVADGDIARGKAAVDRYGCGACHVIPGVRGAQGRVGPQLGDFSNQVYIAGQLANVPENLVAWLQDPDVFSPGTAMPDLGVTEEEARDIAAFLYTLR